MDEGWRSGCSNTPFSIPTITPSEAPGRQPRRSLSDQLSLHHKDAVAEADGRRRRSLWTRWWSWRDACDSAAPAVDPANNGRRVDDLSAAAERVVFLVNGNAGAITALQLPVRNVPVLTKRSFFPGGSLIQVITPIHCIRQGGVRQSPIAADVMANNSPVFPPLLAGVQGSGSQSSPVDFSTQLCAQDSSLARTDEGYAGPRSRPNAIVGHVVLLDQPHVADNRRERPEVFNAAFFARDRSASASGLRRDSGRRPQRRPSRRH